MLFTIQVNNRKIKAHKGETILSALNRNGIMIPTLCRMKDFTPTGACRICVVEVEGSDKLVTACSQPVEEWMKIWTHSPRVITARKTIVELLLSNHPDDCLYCDKNQNCELQRLAESLNIRERRIRAKKIHPRLDQSSPAIVRDLSKCILCGRCIRVCEELVTSTSLDFISKGNLTHVGPAMDRDFNFSSCIHCGRCVLVCPTGALHEKHNITEVQEYLNQNDIIKVIQYSPLVPSGVAHELGLKYNSNFDGMLNSILRKIGFDKVFLTGAGADVSIVETAQLLYDRVKRGDRSPLYLSACPAWVKYAEQAKPSLLPYLSSVKSPQQITGVLIKSVVASLLGVKPEKIYSVSASPCMAMKFEARRDGMMRKGISDVDSVMTVRELVRLIRLYGIDVTNIEPEVADAPLDRQSAAASLAETSGGLAESVVRMLSVMMTKGDLDKTIIRKFRASSAFREVTVKIADKELNVAIVEGLNCLEKLEAALEEGKYYDLVEVMTCNGGCINGAGLPFGITPEERSSRTKSIYRLASEEMVNLPDRSSVLEDLYDIHIKGNEDIADKSIFHTRYERIKVLL